MDVLIVGSSGNIGSAVYNKLREDFQVKGVDPNEASTTDIVGSALEVDENPEIVINLAGKKRGSVDELIDSQVNFVSKLCDKYQDSKIIHASSASIYQASRDPIAEDDVKAPRNTYGKAKLLAEDVIREKADSYVILRIFNPYGLRLESKDVVSIFLKRALEDKDLLIKGSRHSERDFIYKKDLVSAVRESFTLNNETVNVGAGRGITLEEVAKIIRRQTGSDSEIVYRGGQKESFVADITKLKKSTNYDPKYSFEEGIKEFFSHEVI